MNTDIQMPPKKYHAANSRVVSKATGNSRLGIPGNRGPQNSRQEFPGISEILAGITGISRFLSFFPIFIVDYDMILVFNLTAF